MNNQYSYIITKLSQCQLSHIFKQLLFSTCLLAKKRRTHQDFFPIVDHVESPEKGQCNMATPHFALTPLSPPPPMPNLFLSKNFKFRLPPPISINFEKN